MVSIMKSLTQFAGTCLTLTLALAFYSSFTHASDEPIIEEHTEVSEVLVPLSAKEIKKHKAGPKRGASMKQVEAKYGKAIKVHPTKGKPPITRWDYPEFSVYFESNSVIHTVSRSN